jgi:hypothetical protein
MCKAQTWHSNPFDTAQRAAAPPTPMMMKARLGKPHDANLKKGNK